MWRLLLLRKWWFDVSVRGSGVRKDEMTVLACPSYHPTARASDPSLSCKEKEVLCSVRERECCGAAGWGWKRRRKRRRGGDDRVTAWLIIFVAHLSPNNTQTLDRRGRGAEKDGETQKDIKTKSETGEGGDRSTARQQGLKGGVWVRRKKKKKPWNEDDKSLGERRGATSDGILDANDFESLIFCGFFAYVCMLRPSASVSAVSGKTREGWAIFLS